MYTRLATFAGRLLESGWLAAIIIVPLLFNVYSERVFEEDKIPLLRSIALMMVAWGIVFVIERGRAALTHDNRPWYRWPLVIPALVLTGAYLIATVFSVNPNVSWWGAYIRRQGTYSWLSYIVMFLAIVLTVRDKRQVSRIVNIMLLASVPAALYAFLQNQGLDHLPWGGDVQRRVSSVAGNPIFISAYLIMVMPLTLMRVIEHFRTLWREDSKAKGDEVEAEPAKTKRAEPNYLASALLAGAYLFLLFLQVITIVFSQSRGPLLGILVGLAFFTILASLPISRWLTLTFAGLAVAGVAFLIVFNLPNSPLEPLKELPYIGRMGRVFEVNEGNGLVRALIWQGAEKMIAENPARSIVGFGPEAMYMSYTPYYPPELAQVEKRNASPDRSHNETFDSIIMTGWIGLVAQFTVFISIFYYAMKWLGLVGSRRQRITFFTLLAVGAVIGSIIPPLVDNGNWRFAGVGLPFGLAAGLVVYLLIFAIALRGDFKAQLHPQYLLLVALLSAIIAHFIEIHFGIAVGVTRLYFWVMAALVVVVGWQMTREDGVVVDVVSETAVAPTKRRAPTAPSGGSRRDARGEIATMVTYSLLMGLVLAVMTFDFITPSVEISAKGYSIVWLFAATFIFGALLVSAEAAQESVGRLSWLMRLGLYAAVTLGMWCLFWVFLLPMQAPSNLQGNVSPQQLIDAGLKLANTMSVMYLFAFITMFASAYFLMGESAAPKANVRVKWVPYVAGALSILAIPILISTNLNVTRADVLAKQGAAYERRQEWDVAEIFYQAALDMQSTEDRYFLNMGRVYLEQARRATTLADRDAAFRQGQDVLEKAQATNPLNMDHARNLASLHRVWAATIQADDPAGAEAHYASSEIYYAQATRLSPNNAAVWNDFALLRVERGDTVGAEELFAQSLAIDTQYINTYILRGNFYLQEERWEEALADYTSAVAIDPVSVPSLSGQAFALAKLDRLNEAITKNHEILRLQPNDFTAQKNLALLYRDSGDLTQALQYANLALAIAPEAERSAIEVLIQELTAAGTGGTTTPPG
jgi:tetratricopeptide (TPR) repeat protein